MNITLRRRRERRLGPQLGSNVCAATVNAKDVVALVATAQGLPCRGGPPEAKPHLWGGLVEGFALPVTVRDGPPQAVLVDKYLRMVTIRRVQLVELRPEQVLQFDILPPGDAPRELGNLVVWKFDEKVWDLGKRRKPDRDVPRCWHLLGLGVGGGAHVQNGHRIGIDEGRRGLPDTPVEILASQRRATRRGVVRVVPVGRDPLTISPPHELEEDVRTQLAKVEGVLDERLLVLQLQQLGKHGVGYLRGALARSVPRIQDIVSLWYIGRVCVFEGAATDEFLAQRLRGCRLRTPILENAVGECHCRHEGRCPILHYDKRSVALFCSFFLVLPPPSSKGVHPDADVFDERHGSQHVIDAYQVLGASIDQCGGRGRRPSRSRREAFAIGIDTV